MAAPSVTRRFTVATDVDDLVVAFESVAIDEFVGGQLNLPGEFPLASVPLVPDAFVKVVDSITRLPHVVLARTASPDDVSALRLVEDLLDELDVLPVCAVPEALPECPDDGQVFDALVALVPVTTLDVSEILPLESSRVRSSTGDVGDLCRIDADDFEGIGDGGVGSGVPPAK